MSSTRSLTLRERSAAAARCSASRDASKRSRASAILRRIAARSAAVLAAVPALPARSTRKIAAAGAASTPASGAGSAAAGRAVGSSAASAIVDSDARHRVRKLRAQAKHEDDDGREHDGCDRSGSGQHLSSSHGRTVVNTTSARVSASSAPRGAGATSSHANAKPSRQGSIAGNHGVSSAYR